ncbi:MAG TPA: MarR family transcriptional regulator [Methylomusa anaerophila]|uniref:MarR family protein n=1 Tax=Methylomusa anaerophila TaxID=1930071 RepID=A0A348AK06_9FIRM|nr:MarR family transcriptional regulator [Methylomusa anaerophila]BBB91404.1 MarR family protein [Methylomusa anaerophila]HML90171.1 MarR family transcriptional regulator [Methylomusa anaerophila]
MLARCIQSICDIKYREISLQRGQFIFLTRICENPGINLIELSNILKVDKATTTKAIKKLQEENYVLRNRNETDKRMWHLFPSPKAQEIYAYIIQDENKNIETCFTGFSPEEREAVYKLLKRMRENIEQDWRDLKRYKEEQGGTGINFSNAGK